MLLALQMHIQIKATQTVWRFPKTAVQLCIVHMVHNSLYYVSWKLRKVVADDLPSIKRRPPSGRPRGGCRSMTVGGVLAARPSSNHGGLTGRVSRLFFEYPSEIQKVSYITNAIGSVNVGLRSNTKDWGSFPSDDALLQLFYLALNNICSKGTIPISDWKAALTRFTNQFENRLPKP